MGMRRTPLRLPESYGVSLTLQRPGSDDPDKPVESGAYRFTVDPEPWGNPVTYTENL